MEFFDCLSFHHPLFPLPIFYYLQITPDFDLRNEAFKGQIQTEPRQVEMNLYLKNPKIPVTLQKSKVKSGYFEGALLGNDRITVLVLNSLKL